MTTSRTGTTRWKKLRQQAIHQAKQNNQTRCPICKAPLNYNTPLHPKSPEADHITPHTHGGQDTLENIRIICRQCNQKLGGKLATKTKNKHQHAPKPKTPHTKINW